MAEASSSMTLTRVARWVRAIRGVAWTRHLVEMQGQDQQALRQELESLKRAHEDLIVQTTDKLDSSAKQLVDALEQMLVMRRGLDDVIAMQQQLDTAQRQLDTGQQRLDTTQQQHAAEQQQLAAKQQQLDEKQQQLTDTQQTLTAALESSSISQRRLDDSLAGLRNAQGELDARQAEFRAELARLAPSIPRLARAGDGDAATWLYAAFEETFRGTRDQIRERLAAYLPDARAAHTATGGVVIDVGCGRGEWLELMRDEGIPSRGVDENALVVDQCRERGLDAIHGDAISYLEKVAEQSLAAVTAFHVVEHLSLPRHLQLLVAAHRAIAPDGVLILETPNPENLVVGAWTFHMDPSHLRPLPPTLLRFLIEAVGFEVADVRRLNSDDSLVDRAAQEQWPAGVQQLLCGPRDFSVIARRPKI
jgi:O-antigen chain-terminating methyltransferase